MKMVKYLFKQFSKKNKLLTLQQTNFLKTNKNNIDNNLLNLNNLKKNQNSKFYFTNSAKSSKDNNTSLINIISINQDKSLIENTNTHLEVIAEMKGDIYVILKLTRILSFLMIPLNGFAFMYTNPAITADFLFTQGLSSLAFVVFPYIFSENFVVNMKYDRRKDQMHITKLNFMCKLTTRVFNVRNLVRTHKKYNLKPFSLFKDKQSGESFSILKICNIKNLDLLNSLIPDKIAKGKRKDDINQRLIDLKMNKSAKNLNFVKFFLISYFIFTVGFLNYQFKQYNHNEFENK